MGSPVENFRCLIVGAVCDRAYSVTGLRLGKRLSDSATNPRGLRCYLDGRRRRSYGDSLT